MTGKTMKRKFPIAVLAALAIGFTSVTAIGTPTEARADWLGGSLIGGSAGAIIGGIIGGRGGAAAGALIGGSVGAIEGDRRARARYYRGKQRRYRRAPARRARAAPRRAAPRRSDLVVNVQVSLQRLGYSPGSADGLMGPATSRAIKAYQKKNGLLETGAASPELLDHMRKQGG